MRIGGIDPKTLPNEDILVLPRGEGRLVLRARAIPDSDEFRTLVPEPKAPGKFTKDGWTPDTDNASYKSVMAEYNKRYLAWLVIKSLEPSQIEWDSVDDSNPGTWVNWETDLKNNGFNQAECNLVLGLVMGTNSLDESKLKKARELFLHGPQPAPPAASVGPSTEPTSTQSGAPVNA